MLLLVAGGYWLLSTIYAVFYYYGYAPYGPVNRVAAILYNLYYGLALALFLGGWITGLLGASAGGPLIAQEFKRQTWESLAVTPLTTAEIVRDFNSELCQRFDCTKNIFHLIDCPVAGHIHAR